MENPILDAGISANADSQNTKLSDIDREYLHSAGGWAKFLGIIGFIGCGLIVLGGIVSFVTLSRYSSFSPLLAIIYLIFGGIAFLPCLYLFNFGSKMQDASRYEDGFTTSEAFRYLRAYFRFSGIMIIVVLSLYLLFILLMVAGLSRIL